MAGEAKEEREERRGEKKKRRKKNKKKKKRSFKKKTSRTEELKNWENKPPQGKRVVDGGSKMTRSESKDESCLVALWEKFGFPVLQFLSS